METHSLKERALKLLRQRFGFDSFRAGQWEVMENILGGRDTLVLMPTGGGKSLCFQLPALMSEGCCVVISPLIALMNDQVAALQANGLPAATVNSLCPESINQTAFDEAARGKIKLLYISPERLLAELENMKSKIHVSFFAVDEAHCISQWGHDFRPVYTQLARLKELFPRTPVMALTATADRLTREDIGTALALDDPFRHIGSFDRPNLSLKVIQGARQNECIRYVADLIRRHPLDCGILYCLSRKNTERMAELLSGEGFRIGCYHAGLDATTRRRVQKQFTDGKLQAICATVAFGMGIDKSNIRWVVHNNIPANIESFYQEIGRAGRDGLPAETILFYSYGDIITRRGFLEESGQREISESKLGFMQRYAEASVCRRRILLSYFNEETGSDCGNCDNCLSPRPRFDGTVLAQKALSAIIRVGNAESIGTVIEILRGMHRQYIADKGYHMLPTYGVGHDIPAPEWHAYILQMIQLGLIEVAYDEHFHLRPTPAGLRVVKGKEKVDLVKYEAPTFKKSVAASSPQPAPELSLPERLEQDLKSLRRRLAEERDTADYMIFSDATIAAIVKNPPETVDHLADIEGISLVRLSAYFKDILSTIRKAMGHKRTLPQGSSDRVTLLMFRNGMEVEEISTIRNLAPVTVIHHLIKAFVGGESVDLPRVMPPGRFSVIEEALRPITDLRLRNPEEYSTCRDTLYHEVTVRLGATEEEIARTINLRRYVEVVDGTYRPLPPTPGKE